MNYNKPYLYSSGGGGRTSSRATNSFEQSGGSQYQIPCYSDNQSYMYHDIQNRDRASLPVEDGDTIYSRRPQHRDSDYPNTYRNAPSTHIEAEYRGPPNEFQKDSSCPNPIRNYDSSFRETEANYKESQNYPQQRNSSYPNPNKNASSAAFEAEYRGPSSKSWERDSSYQNPYRNYSTPTDINYRVPPKEESIGYRRSDDGKLPTRRSDDIPPLRSGYGGHSDDLLREEYRSRYDHKRPQDDFQEKGSCSPNVHRSDSGYGGHSDDILIREEYRSRYDHKRPQDDFQEKGSCYPNVYRSDSISHLEASFKGPQNTSQEGNFSIPNPYKNDLFRNSQADYRVPENDYPERDSSYRNPSMNTERNYGGSSNNYKEGETGYPNPYRNPSLYTEHNYRGLSTDNQEVDSRYQKSYRTDPSVNTESSGGPPNEFQARDSSFPNPYRSQMNTEPNFRELPTYHQAGGSNYPNSRRNDPSMMPGGSNYSCPNDSLDRNPSRSNPLRNDPSVQTGAYHGELPKTQSGLPSAGVNTAPGGVAYVPNIEGPLRSTDITTVAPLLPGGIPGRVPGLGSMLSTAPGPPVGIESIAPGVPYIPNTAPGPPVGIENIALRGVGVPYIPNVEVPLKSTEITPVVPLLPRGINEVPPGLSTLLNSAPVPPAAVGNIAPGFPHVPSIVDPSINTDITTMVPSLRGPVVGNMAPGVPYIPKVEDPPKCTDISTMFPLLPGLPDIDGKMPDLSAMLNTVPGLQSKVDEKKGSGDLQFPGEMSTNVDNYSKAIDDKAKSLPREVPATSNIGDPSKNTKTTVPASGLSDIDEREKNIPDPNTLPWNMTVTGPLSNLTFWYGPPRELSKYQEDALKSAISTVVAKIRNNEATLDDIPAKPIGVSVYYFRDLLKEFGIVVKDHQMYLANWLPRVTRNERKSSYESRNNSKDRFGRDSKNPRRRDEDDLIKYTNRHKFKHTRWGPKRQKSSKPVELDEVIEILDSSDDEPLPFEKPFPLEERHEPPDPNLPVFALIAPKSYPLQIFSDAEVNELKKELVAKNVLRKKLNTITMESLDGVFCFKCFNRQHYAQLKRAIESEKRVDNLPAMMIQSSQLMNSQLLRTTISAPDVPFDTMITLLNSQNESLDASNWLFKLQAKTNNQRTYTVGMDKISFELIKYWGFSLFYGFEKIKFQEITDMTTGVDPDQVFIELLKDYSRIPLYDKEEISIRK